MIFKANWQDIDTDFMNSDFQKKRKKKSKKIIIINLPINLISQNIKKTSFRVQKPPSIPVLWWQPCSKCVAFHYLLPHLKIFTNNLPLSEHFICSIFFSYLTIYVYLYSKLTLLIKHRLSSTISLIFGNSKMINCI